MLPIVTAFTMRQLDRRAIEESGIPGAELMENAGRACAERAWQLLAGSPLRRVATVCGTGNNGGDGLVAARHLAERGADCETYLLGPVARLKGEAGDNARRLRESGLPLRELAGLAPLAAALARCDLAIDAVLGTGLSSAPLGPPADAIRLLNESGRRILSVDIPSGVSADSGEAFDPAVRANWTVALALPKFGNLLHPGAGLGGDLAVADIGIPPGLWKDHADTWLLDDDHVRTLLPPRRPDGHKGTFGTCLLVCGAPGYSGAACLAGEAAARAGAGLVRLAVPGSVLPVVETRLLEAVKHPLPETPAGTIAAAALEPLLELAAHCRCVAIGPGLTTEPETAETVRELVRQLDLPLVIDADGLNALAGHLDLLRARKAPTILTPHPGELARLLGASPELVSRDRIEVCRRFARDHGAITVLKGAPTVIGDPAGRCYVNATGNSGLGSGGTGDVLTGLLAGLLCQRAKPLAAACAAAFLHGRAGDIAAGDLTEYGLKAGDVARYLPAAFRSLLEPVD